MNFFALEENHVRFVGVTALVLGASIAVACADKPVDPNSRDRGHHSGTGGSDADGGAGNDAGAPGQGGEVSTGGGPASGGAPSAGGTSTGGTNTGGANTGGNVGTGGASTGGAGTSGTSTGGASTGGASTGGASTGGASSGGSDTGGSNTGGDIGMGGDPGTGGASPVNLHPNGTFETNTNGWFSWNGTVSQTTTRAHGGSASGLLSGRAGSGPMATDLFNPGSANSVVAPGHTYTVTFWVTIANAASADVNLTRKFGCNKTPGVPADGTNDSYSWLVSPKAVADGEWVEFTSTLTVPDAATCDLADVLVYVEGPAVTVDLYVDDVAIYEN